MTLYEIDKEILNCVDSETGEVICFDKLDSLVAERDKKIENVALWIKNLESDAEQMKAERDSLDRRMKSTLSKAEWLKKWLSQALDCKPFERPRVKVTFRKSVATEVNADILPKKWSVRKITYTPDKSAIKSALLAGQKIKGASLVEHQNIQIK